MASYLALIPLIYCRYHFPGKFSAAEDAMAVYLLRVLATGAFGGSPDNLIDRLVRDIAGARRLRSTQRSTPTYALLDEAWRSRRM